MDATCSRANSLIEISRVFSAAAIGAVGVSFAFGLLIVNLRLAPYGVSSISLLRNDYVLAGALFLFLMAFMSGTLYFSLYILEKAKLGLDRKQRLAGPVLNVLFAIFMLLFPMTMLFILSGFNPILLSWKILLMLFVLIWANQSFLELLQEVASIFNVVRENQQSNPIASSLKLNVYHVAMSILFLLLGLMMYTGLVYPNISRSVGGGRLEKAILIPSELGMRVCKNLRFRIQPDSVSIGPLEVLTESRDDIVVLSNSELIGYSKTYAITLRRELFDAVIAISPYEQQ